MIHIYNYITWYFFGGGQRAYESIGDSRSNHQIGMYHGLNKRDRLLGGSERLNLWPLVGARKLGGSNGLIG